MSGNACFRAVNTTVLSVCAVEAPIVITSAAIDEWLAETYRRVHTRPGLLQKLAGVLERRWWPEDVSFADAAAIAGSKALAEAGIRPEQIGVMCLSVLLTWVERLSNLCGRCRTVSRQLERQTIRR